MKNRKRTNRRLHSLIIKLLAVCTVSVTNASDFTKAEIEAWLEIDGRNPADLVTVLGDKPAYTSEEVDELKKITLKKPEASAVNKFSPGFQGIKIRSDSSDLLKEEFPSATKAKADDLAGLKLSYAKDIKRDGETWSVQGALIAPFIWKTRVEPLTVGEAQLNYFGLLPSVTINKIDSSLDGTAEADSLLFRAGIFSSWQGGMIPEQILRGFVSYETDTDFMSSTPALELEYEPVFDIGRKHGIGSYHSLLLVDNEDADPNEPGTARKTILGYQLRTIFRALYGKTGDAGNKDIPEEQFFRAGARLEAIINPLFSQKLSAKVSYEHLFDIQGDAPNDSLLNVSLAYSLDEEGKYTLSASYQNGGVDLTKDDVETLLLGVGIRF